MYCMSIFRLDVIVARSSGAASIRVPQTGNLHNRDAQPSAPQFLHSVTHPHNQQHPAIKIIRRLNNNIKQPYPKISIKKELTKLSNVIIVVWACEAYTIGWQYTILV